MVCYPGAMHMYGSVDDNGQTDVLSSLSKKSVSQEIGIGACRIRIYCWAELS